MNNNILKEFSIPQRHLLAIASGIIGGSIPNNFSNINHILLGSIFAILFVKIIYGDYDNGYKWTKFDIIFWFITLLEGAFGAYIINILQTKYKITTHQI